MGIESISFYFSKYGLIAIFIIVLLEYLNLPGFPAGVIMPLAGIFAANGKIQFFIALLVSVAAGLLGSWILYFMGLKGGELFLNAYMKKFPKQRQAIERNLELIRGRGSIGVFMAKLIPMIRTLISIPAGVTRMDFVKYTLNSVAGIFIWNLVFMGAGYFFGDAVFGYLGAA